MRDRTEKMAALYAIFKHLKIQLDQISELKKTVEESKAQNLIMVKTLRDIHLVLSTLTEQGAEQREELFEIRKRLTDLHEDTMGSLKMDASSSRYASDVYYSSDEEDVAVQQICERRQSLRHDKP